MLPRMRQVMDGLWSALPVGVWGQELKAEVVAMIGVTILYMVMHFGDFVNHRYAVFSEVGKYLDWIAENFNMLPPDDFV